jgi:hypothetical protein
VLSEETRVAVGDSTLTTHLTIIYIPTLSDPVIEQDDTRGKASRGLRGGKGEKCGGGVE